MIRRSVFLSVIVAVSLYAQAPVPAQSSATADNQIIDAATNEWLLTGHARLQDEQVLLLADEVRWNEKTATATAVGHVAFTRGEMRLLADRIVYHRQDNSFYAEGVRFGSYPYFVEGFSAEGTRKEITVTRAKLSYGEPGPWQPTLVADKVIIAPGQHIRTEKAVGGIGHVQALPFPKWEHNIAQPLPVAAQITGGFRRSLGAFIDSSLHVPVTPGLRLGADVGLFTSRGIMIGPSGRYEKPDSPDDLHGYFRTGFINDHGDKKTDILGRPVPENRAFAEWQHRQTLAENLTLTAQLNWWKDSEVLRDFRPRSFFPVQEPDTFVESVYTGQNYFISAFARFQPNKFHRVQQRLPEIRFDLLPSVIGDGFYQRFNASVAVLREDFFRTGLPLFDGPIDPDIRPRFLPTGPVSYTDKSGRLVSPNFFGTALQTTRVDAYYGIERPIAPTEWFAFTPIAGARMTSYTRTSDTVTLNSAGRPFFPVPVSAGSYTRLLGEVGADAALRASGVFDYKNPQWKIDGLRHLVTPRIGYRYIPKADKGRDRILRIDRETFSTYLPPLGLGEQRNIDDLHATNTLRLGIDNVLQTRDAAVGTRDLLVFNVANDFRFRRRPGERDVSEIHTEAAVMPAPWLQVDIYQSFAPQNFTLREFNSGVTLHDGTAWSVRFGNNYLQNQIQDYSVDGRFRINEKYEVRTRHQYDSRRHRFNEQSYGIVQNLGNTWLVSYAVNLYSGRRRESSFGFRIEIDTVRF